MGVIKIYGKEGCVYCKRAVRLATEWQLDYIYIDINEPGKRDEMFKLVPNAKTVPQIFWHDKHIGGYQELAVEIENTAGGHGESDF